MPEVEDECTFIAKADQCKFLTQTNGDKIIIDGLNLLASKAASLAWLVNQNSDLEIQVRVKQL
jgi:hypothetical protein